jgi:hypothetical protein
MIEMPPQGLLPQLVDVLEALADSQQLLARRVRTACLEQSGGPVPVVEELPPSPASGFALQSVKLISRNDDSVATLAVAPTEQAAAVDPLPQAPAPRADNHDSASSAMPGLALPDVTRRAATGAEPESRDYNFFDELDATLADLTDPPGGPGATTS